VLLLFAPFKGKSQQVGKGVKIPLPDKSGLLPLKKENKLAHKIFTTLNVADFISLRMTQLNKIYLKTKTETLKLKLDL
jgi:hypothetical protein